MKKIIKAIWEYPIIDKHPELSLVLMAIIAPLVYFILFLFDLYKLSYELN